jgi:hypothetical protein
MSDKGSVPENKAERAQWERPHLVRSELGSTAGPTDVDTYETPLDNFGS